LHQLARQMQHPIAELAELAGHAVRRPAHGLRGSPRRLRRPVCRLVPGSRRCTCRAALAAGSRRRACYQTARPRADFR
jgi:hypothetical protein